MRPDRLHVAVRPRGVLECLDFAVFFCGRRPLGVATAAIVGMLPCFLLNRWLLSRTELAPQGFATALLATLLEAPWATAPLTLYLGQAVFSDRFSWRIAARGLAVALPGLILFQLLLRGILEATVVLSPIVFLTMCQLNPVLLLEQPSLGRVWPRLSAMNSRSADRRLAVVAIQGIVLFLGTSIGGELIRRTVSVWRGSPPEDFSQYDFQAVGTVVIPAAEEAAFWGTLALLTVFRFFYYLDERIRREGWDVELKLRSAGTYAGLPDSRSTPTTRSTGLHRVAGAIVIAVACGTATAAPPCTATATQAATDAVAEASPGDSAPSGAAPTNSTRSSPVHSGTAARRALEQQRFPWYDAKQDAYRSATSPPRRAPDIDFGEPARRSVSRGPSLGTILFAGLFAAAVAAAIWLVVSYGLPTLPAAAAPTKGTATVLAAEHLAELPAAARAHDGDFLARAEALASAGDYAGAMVFFHAWQLVELHARGALELARGKTTRRYAAEVARSEPALAGLFARASRLFEDAFFGRLPVGREDFLAVWNRRHELARPAGEKT